MLLIYILFYSFFFFNDTATTEIYTLSLHDALPISRLEAHARRSHRSALGPRAAHPGARRQPLLDGEHPAPEARVPAVARRLLPVRRAVLRAGPGRAARPPHRAAARCERERSGSGGDERLSQRLAFLLQAVAGDPGLLRLRHHARRARGVPLSEPEPRLGRLLPEDQLPPADVAHYPPAWVPLILSPCPRPSHSPHSWPRRAALHSGSTCWRARGRAGRCWAWAWPS